MGIIKGVVKGVTLGALTHIALTGVCLDPPKFAQQEKAADTNSGQVVVVDEDRRKLYGKTVTEVYRGQKRTARVAEMYSQDCELQTPLLVLHGKDQVTRYFEKGVASCCPVQLNSKVDTKNDGLKVLMANQFSLMGITRVIPMEVELELNSDGKIQKHVERWTDRGDPPQALNFTRQLNGFVFNNISIS